MSVDLTKKGWLKAFMDFTQDLRISSKEVLSEDDRGVKLVLWHSQRYFLEQVSAGLEVGQRHFFCLKGRQEGITTISLVVDVFWLALHRDLRMALVCDTEKNRDANRITIKQYVNSFPEGYFGEDFYIVKDNRQFMLFSNGSRLDFLVAGIKKKSSTAWGEGQGYAAVHLTEIASYGDEDGLESFEESFAQTNPARLFLYESTAKGIANIWHSKWKAAEADPLLGRAMFIGWYMGDTNIIQRSDPRFQVYGGYASTQAEREKCIEVERRYGVKVSPEQLAWIRWKTDKSDDSQMNRQNQPWLPDEAFVQSGYSFFQVRVLTEAIKALDAWNETDEGGFIGYRYEFGRLFEETRMVPVEDPDESETIDLKVWEEPKEGAKYVIGCDTAYGRNDHKDKSVVSVFRCFADKLVQVAEFASDQVEIKQLAWVLAHLAGAYRDCLVNPEVNGPGGLMIGEWDHIRASMTMEANQVVRDKDWEEAFQMARWYLYHRPDSMGAGFAIGFMTSWRTKSEIMHQLRGEWVCGNIIVRSRRLLEEMVVVINDDGVIGAPESKDPACKDDRVFAMALANRAWLNWIKQPMMTQSQTYDLVMAQEKGETTPMNNTLNRIVGRFFMTREEQAQAQSLGLIEGPRWKVERGLA